MESLEQALQFTREGRFGEALRTLEGGLSATAGRQSEVLYAELLARVGQTERADALAVRLLKSKHVTASQKSTCETIRGRILSDTGRTDDGVAHLQRAALIAQQALDLQALFSAKFELLAILCDRSGPAAGASLLAEMRHIAIKLGEPETTTRLHILIANIESKRGLFENARRHTSIARQILKASPDAHLEALCGNIDMGIAVMRYEFEVAREIGLQAFEMARQSGVARSRRALQGNLGNLFFELGEFDKALEYFDAALDSPNTNLAHTASVFETMARLHLSKGDVDSCDAALRRVESLIDVEEDRQFYEHRYTAHTRLRLLIRQGRIEEALSSVDTVLALATRAGDGLLQKQVQLTKAELLQRLGQLPASMALITEVLPGLVGLSPELYARCEQILAFALKSQGDSAADAHYDRAFRIYKALGSVPKQHELLRDWTSTPVVRMRDDRSARDANLAKKAASPDRMLARKVLHGLAMAFTQATRPDLIAPELLDVLQASGCADSVNIRGLHLEAGDTTAGSRCLSVGFRNNREIQLVIEPKTDVDSIATVNALQLLLTAVNEVQRGRAEREERANLWPAEDLPGDQRSVLSGRMRELMDYARRIARTKVNVLVTGESGTGKEILARAIHDFSDRAGKPFVPFNCTAIPRDLLESQLFGHRRGAFTGADRDQLGLIRAARDGTLFLDEVGELGLDLQPKLLRFLESGEISPLGEPGAMTVDVRIVAATNTKLEDAVGAGRFREDLFYRLNVVRLSIPPLRERRDEIPGLVNHFVVRAADEFKKGHLRVGDETMERLLLYRWPGNVRQLQNEVRRMVALAEADSTLLPHAISDEILGALPIFRPAPADGREIAVGLTDKLMPTIARVECEMIRAALRTHHGKVNAVAKALGISRKGLYLKRQRLGL